jgi:hypothetical protein
MNLFIIIKQFFKNAIIKKYMMVFTPLVFSLFLIGGDSALSKSPIIKLAANTDVTTSSSTGPFPLNKGMPIVDVNKHTKQKDVSGERFNKKVDELTTQNEENIQLVQAIATTQMKMYGVIFVAAFGLIGSLLTYIYISGQKGVIGLINTNATERAKEIANVLSLLSEKILNSVNEREKEIAALEKEISSLDKLIEQKIAQVSIRVSSEAKEVALRVSSEAKEAALRVSSEAKEVAQQVNIDLREKMNKVEKKIDVIESKQQMVLKKVFDVESTK